MTPKERKAFLADLSSMLENNIPFIMVMDAGNGQIGMKWVSPNGSMVHITGLLETAKYVILNSNQQPQPPQPAQTPVN